MAFYISLYQIYGEKNEVDKSARIEYAMLNGLSLDTTALLKDEFNLLNPTILVKVPTRPEQPAGTYNYVYIGGAATQYGARTGEIARFYFVKDITIVRPNVYEYSLEIDVLHTYKGLIQRQYLFCDRTGKREFANRYIIDKNIPFRQGTDVEYSVVENNLEVPDENILFAQNEKNQFWGFCNFIISGYRIEEFNYV